MSDQTHDCPREGESVTLCCGRSPFDLPRSDRMTLDPALVTCKTTPARLSSPDRTLTGRSDGSETPPNDHSSPSGQPHAKGDLQ